MIHFELGDTISTETITRLTHCHPDQPHWRLEMLKLKNAMEESYFARTGQLCTIQTIQDTLHVCTHEEAAHLNRRHFDNNLRRAAKAHARSLSVDDSGFTEQAKARHRRSVDFQDRLLTAVAKVKKSFKPQPHSRVTPTFRNGQMDSPK